MERTKEEAHADLLTLRNFLLDLPHRKFHMPVWSSPDATETSCGTAGCAAGWAATIFHAKGLRLVRPLVSCSHVGMHPAYGEAEGNYAFALFFGINWAEAAFICVDLNTYCDQYKLINENDIAPAHVADRITKIGKLYAPDLAWDEPAPEPAEACHV